MLKTRLLALALASMGFVSTTQAAGFAAQVVSYDPGQGFAVDYTNSAAVLGEPSRIDPYGYGIDPFYPPYDKAQIASLGTNGSLVVKFNTPIVNDPANPYGIDLIIYGHSGFSVTNVAWIGELATDGTFFTKNNTGSNYVSVSCDGVHFYRLDPSRTPAFDNYFPTDGQGDFHTPVDPSVSAADFTGATLAKIRALYNGSAGGTGYDISFAQDATGNSMHLPYVNYVRIDELGGTALIDAISDVFTGTVITEDFTCNPLERGWKIFGNTNLYRWNSTNHTLEVTWDSSQSNSFFYHPINTVANRRDNFSASFDLLLKDCTLGITPGKSNTFEITFGFQNYTNAASPKFYRAVPQYNPNLVEFAFFPDAGLRATIWPCLWSTNGVLSSNGGQSDQTFATLPLGVTMHVNMTYDATRQTLSTSLTTNGVSVVQIKEVPLMPTFTDFRVDQFAFPNYSDAVQPGGPTFAGSVLAHGVISNLIITAPPPPVQDYAGQLADGQWKASFVGQTNWVYTLEGTADFETWTPVSTPVNGGGKLMLKGSSTQAPQQFFRIRSDREY